jgi:hypothetical protein
MNFIRTFDTVPPEDCKLWAVAYPNDLDEDGKKTDVFQRLLNEWNDINLLASFFNDNKEDLLIWEPTLTVDKAIDWAIDEAQEMEEKLEGIISGAGEYSHLSINDVFTPLHKNEYALKRKNENLRKGKAHKGRTMLRFYAVELDDGTLVISGGGIKITDGMEPQHLKEEEIRLKNLQDYIKQQAIVTCTGLF